ncbi:MAG: glycosyltransferase family 2 protein [Myxococcales bacterium]|nr:glycosyltransferase family 2 protein [Myxococcales bacterium]
MELEAQSLVILRLLGGLFGFGVLVHAFQRFRQRRIARSEAAFRWLIGLAIAVICVYPDSVNSLVSMLAMERAAYGRMLVLLVLSNLALWFLLLRERGKVYLVSRNLDRFIRIFALSRGTERERERLQGTQILVAMPALNEGENIGPVLQRMPEAIEGRKVGVVVIDDGSDDNTAEIVERAGYSAFSNPMRRGQGAALRLAYDIATHIGAEVVVTLDADGQHRPEEIENVVKPILEGDSDFVVGSRLLGQREADSKFRLAGIYLNNLLINLLAGTRISDCSSGFKAIRVSSLAKVVLTEDQFQAAEAIIASAHSGLRIGEAPITVLRRASGESKKGRDITYGLNFARSVFKSWWR